MKKVLSSLTVFVCLAVAAYSREVTFALGKITLFRKDLRYV
jgi:hypothetical protein